MRPVALVLFVSIALAGPLLAQTGGASITGLISDPSGAAAAGASVTATSQATGVRSRTLANAAGLYSIPSLPVGAYVVQVELAGFRSATTPPFTLEARQVARLDFTLQVGAVAEVLDVTGEASLQSESAAVGEVISGSSAVRLPLDGRNPAQLVLLLPGAVTPAPGIFKELRNLGSGGRPFVNGNREQTNSFTLDGIDMNESIDNLIAYQPSPDALAEVGVETANYAADLGNVAGAVVSNVTRSGSNRLQGSAFEFYRDSRLDANSWSNNRSGAPRPERQQHIFGATLGGPILHDRLFFFADYQGARYDAPGSETLSVAPAEWRRGDLSSVPTPILDPRTGQPFPGNRIPADRIDPGIAALLADTSLYPLPNRSVDGQTGNYVGDTLQTIRSHQGDLRLDWSATASDKLFARFSFAQYESEVGKRPFPLADGMGNLTHAPFRNLALDWTHAGRVVNELTLGFNQVAIQSDTFDWAGVGDLNARFGIPGGQPLPGLSRLDSGLTSIGAAASDTNTLDRTLQASDTVSFLAGRHAIRAGGQYLHYSQRRFFAGNSGLLGFFGFTGAFTGFPFADLLLDQVSYKARSSLADPWTQLHDRYAVFVQDDFKVTSTLTLNLGLRWANTQSLIEKDDRQANFDLQTGAQVLAAPGDRESRALYRSYGGGFEPRLGFAWRPAERWVVRGGFALTQVMEGTGANLRLTLNPPYYYESGGTYDASSGPGSLGDGFADVVAQTEVVGTVRAYDPDFRPQLTRQWSVFIERLLTSSLSGALGYVGESSRYLATPVEGNQPLPGVGDPSTWAPLQQRRPLYDTAPLLTNVSVTAARGHSNYNGLQASLRQRPSHGLEYLVSYTLSKTLSNNLGYYGSPGVASEEPYWMNAYQPEWDYGPAFFDVRHNLVASGSYELPWHQGVLAGLRVSAVFQARSGFPITVFDGRGSSLQSVRGGERPDCVGDPMPADPTVDHWLELSAFRRAAPGTWGDCGVGIARAPGYRNLDLALAKQIGLGGQRSLELRVEGYNVTNTPSFAPPGRNIANVTTFGKITTTVSVARTVQLAARLRF